MAAPSNLPLRIRQAYWVEVRRLLHVRHKLSATAAAHAVRVYAAALRRAGIGDEIYHAAVTETAQGISDGGYAEEPAPKRTKPTKSKVISPRGRGTPLRPQLPSKR